MRNEMLSRGMHMLKLIIVVIIIARHMRNARVAAAVTTTMSGVLANMRPAMCE